LEDTITFYAGAVALEGLLHKHSGTGGVVITHPHPLYGGNLHNNVVAAICKAYHRLNRTTLRFNFRGVGNSQGSYGDGLGEQADVLAAISYLADLGLREIDLAGYSFGAWVNAHLNCSKSGIERMVMVSPPVAFIDFAAVSAIDCLKLIVTGGRDDIAPPAMIGELYSRWNPEAHFEVISGADHFYGAYEAQLEAVLLSNIE
jgi:hypothetical protein